jgi:hypothetical protein
MVDELERFTSAAVAHPQWLQALRRAFEIPDVVGDELAIDTLIRLVVPHLEASEIPADSRRWAAGNLLGAVINGFGTGDLDPLLLPDELVDVDEAEKFEHEKFEDLAGTIMGGNSTHESREAILGAVLHLVTVLIAFVKAHPFEDDLLSVRQIQEAS